MHDDFGDYLYSKGFNRFEWRILQDQNSDDALKLLANFSDQTFEKVMRSVQFLEFRSSKTLKFIRCDQNRMTVIGIEVPLSSGIDLLDRNSLSYVSEIDLGGFKSYQKTFDYTVGREQKVFELIESGFRVVDESGYKHLDFIRQSYLN